MASKTDLMTRDKRTKAAKTEYGQQGVLLLQEILEKQSILNNGAFLIRQLAEDSEKKISFSEWEKYYFLLADKKKKTDNPQYYGKTIKELQTISKKLLISIKRKGIGLDEDMAFTLTYHLFLDIPYAKYLSELKVCKKLTDKTPDVFFTISSAMTYLENDIDLVGHHAHTGEMIRAVKLIPHGYQMDENSLTGQKHHIFQLLYGIHVDYLS